MTRDDGKQRSMTMQLTDTDRILGGKVFLHTSTKREDLFTWMEHIGKGHEGRRLVDTWEIPQHPDGRGGVFTLYACTVVLLAEPIAVQPSLF